MMRDADMMMLESETDFQNCLSDTMASLDLCTLRKLERLRQSLNGARKLVQDMAYPQQKTQLC